MTPAAATGNLFEAVAQCAKAGVEFTPELMMEVAAAYVAARPEPKADQ